MKNLRPYFIVSILFIMFHTLCFGSRNDEFVNISVKDGLSQATVYSIIKDKDGFMWIGTENGLNRYDGYNFTHFKKSPNSRNCIHNNSISRLFEDRNGCI